ncbi:MAG TPA: 3-carboxy-cis,cis-muconate cycloisomerase [Candidatus Binatia bacterium]|jgi:3-carboxy-cis,cis-muconate cycloisomerase
MTSLDSAILGPLFSDKEISDLLSDDAFVRTLVDVEIALARAEARLGVIPRNAAERIAEARAERIDVQTLTKGTLRSGFPIIALVEELRKQVGGEAASFVHWGATTQDIMDTACVLQIQSATELFKSSLTDIVRHLSALAERHRNVILAGRTHGQQALPITFGVKIAAWIAPLLRDLQRLEEILPRLMVVQFGGAAGTLAALGDKGVPVMQALADELRLGVPLMPWHAQRDSLAEFAGWLSLVTGSLGKMAQDIILLAQTEIGEVGESTEQGRGGSSTMPQKSNPITSELIIAAARTNASLVSAMYNAQIQEQERGTHGWQMEWLVLPQMVLLTNGALKHALYLASHLQVDGKTMKENIARTNDLVLAEAAVFALARIMPKGRAEELVKKACGVAVNEAKPLIDVVRKLSEREIADGSVDWKSLGQPEQYLGASNEILDRVLEAARRRCASNEPS